MQRSIQKSKKILTVAIVIVSALLLINLLLLLLVNRRDTDTSGADGNVIGETQVTMLPSGRMTLLHATPAQMLPLSARSDDALTLSLWNGHNGKKNFEVTDMLPGDRETREYNVTVKNKKAVSLIFKTEITQNSLLSKGLVFTVDINGTTAYHGTLAAMPELSYALQSGVASQDVLYSIRAELPISANNDYASLSLAVTFRWSLDEDPEETTTEPEETTTRPAETTTEPEETTKPAETTKPGGESPEWPDETVEPDETTEQPIETSTEPEETTEVPPETDPWYPETTTEPPESEPEPPETTTEPEETTEPEPPETDPITPPIPPTCKACCIDRVIESIFGDNGDRCVVCDIVVSIFHTDKDFCICPIGCLIAVIVCISVVGVTASLIVYRFLKKRKEEEIKKTVENQTEQE